MSRQNESILIVARTSSSLDHRLFTPLLTLSIHSSHALSTPLPWFARRQQTPVSYGSATPVDMDDSTHNGNGYYPPAELANTLAITPDIVANGESVGVMAASPKSRVIINPQSSQGKAFLIGCNC